MILETEPNASGADPSRGGCPEWTHGGKPWSYWRNAGQFIYVCGDLLDDDTPDPLTIALLSKAKSAPIKLGITTDPRSRIEHHRKTYFPHGAWLSIRWVDSHAKVIEAALKELLIPWKCAWESEVFQLPGDVEEWLMEAMDEGFYMAQKQCRVAEDNRVSLITDIFPRYYPARWLNRRVAQIRTSTI